ncbi:MAG: hypothetical protein KAS04_06505 [Candidatus Aenigmarchaeota archaeon]|nr:hypothetical protein [Candidatus Aenigmarchaeota archaeon]
MNCPKCNGGAYVSEEEAIKVLETTTPLRIILKTTYICRACNERFSRVFSEDVDAKRKPHGTVPGQEPAPGMPRNEYAVNPAMQTTGASTESHEPADKLRFLDNI